MEYPLPLRKVGFNDRAAFNKLMINRSREENEGLDGSRSSVFNSDLKKTLLLYIDIQDIISDLFSRRLSDCLRFMGTTSALAPSKTAYSPVRSSFPGEEKEMVSGEVLLLLTILYGLVWVSKVFKEDLHA